MKDMSHHAIEIKVIREAPMTTAKLKYNTIHTKKYIYKLVFKLLLKLTQGKLL